MTTKVTIDAHAGWPVRVVATDRSGAGEPVRSEMTMPPNTACDFYIHSTRSLTIEELPHPPEA
jgi:hypothetical protein